MIDELNELENRIDQAVALCRRLWADNLALRDQLVAVQADNRKLSDKLSTVLSRLETMMETIPQPMSDQTEDQS